MIVRAAGEADVAAVVSLWRALEAELPPPTNVDHDEAEELEEVRRIVASGGAFLAERDGEPVGLALTRRTGSRSARLTDLYVAPAARRSGVAGALVHAVAESLAAAGIDVLDLEVQAGNRAARSIYHRWGFVEEAVTLVAPIASLRDRLAAGRHARSFASIHVQTDALGDVERAARAFAPRVGSRGTAVEGPRNGWVTIYDEAADRDPTALLRFAREISSRMGAVVVTLGLELDQVVRLIALDRGGIVDEYLSVPEFYGQLAPGDVIGLAANPTVLARLTGADPAAVKKVAVTAVSPAELPEPLDLLRSIAAVLGLEGADRGLDPGAGG